MPTYSDAPPMLPRPGLVVKVAMALVTGLTLAFAVGINWAGVSRDTFALFCGNTLALMHGQVWRLLTAPLLQAPGGFWHLFGVILSLYFFGVPLEEQWGKKRFARFLILSAVIPSLLQALIDIALPPSINRIFVPDYWYGGMAAASALVVAWGLNFRGIVRIFFVLPVTSGMLVAITVAFPIGYLLIRSMPPEGIPASLAGCFVGWLLGASTPSPLRRYWLKFRIGRLDAEVAREAAQRRKRVERSRLKVIEGGLAKPDPPTDGEKGRGPDGRWLN